MEATVLNKTASGIWPGIKRTVSYDHLGFIPRVRGRKGLSMQFRPMKMKGPSAGAWGKLPSSWPGLQERVSLLPLWRWAHPCGSQRLRPPGRGGCQSWWNRPEGEGARPLWSDATHLSLSTALSAEPVQFTFASHLQRSLPGVTPTPMRREGVEEK